jgi:hypothetical protein
MNYRKVSAPPEWLWVFLALPLIPINETIHHPSSSLLHPSQSLTTLDAPLQAQEGQVDGYARWKGRKKNLHAGNMGSGML